MALNKCIQPSQKLSPFHGMALNLSCLACLKYFEAIGFKIHYRRLC